MTFSIFVPFLIMNHFLMLWLQSDGRDQQNEMKSLWKPLDGRTHEDWLKCRGLPCEDWERTEGMMTELQQKLQKGGTGNVEGAFFVEENSGADLVSVECLPSGVDSHASFQA